MSQLPVQCKCYGSACMFIHKCRQTKRVDQWIDLCDLIKEDIQDAFVDLMKTNINEQERINLKIKVIYETFSQYCRAVDHIYIKEIFTDLNQLFPYIVENKKSIPIEKYKEVYMTGELLHIISEVKKSNMTVMDFIELDEIFKNFK